MATFEDIEAQFASFGLKQESINTITQMHRNALRVASDDPFDFSSLMDSLEQKPEDLASVLTACEDIKLKGATGVHTPLLDYLLSIYEEAYRNEGNTAKLSLAFLNRAKAKKRRKRMSKRVEEHRRRGRDYSAKMAKRTASAASKGRGRFTALY